MDYIIIVAGGKGLRMGGDIPKQFLPIKGKPVLMRTIERFHECSPQLRVILVLPREQQDYWHTLCRDHSFGIDHTVVDGGDTRFGSCRNGLAAIPDDEEGVVGIHDGVRPFVSADTVERCFARARQCGAAIPVLPVTDSLRRVSGDGKSSHGVNRSEYRAVQTPQAFSIQVLKKAYRQSCQDSFTDDASVVEAMGVKVDMVEGNRENIKLTTPFDLKIAETLC